MADCFIEAEIEDIEGSVPLVRALVRESEELQSAHPVDLVARALALPASKRWDLAIALSRARGHNPIADYLTGVHNWVLRDLPVSSVVCSRVRDYGGAELSGLRWRDCGPDTYFIADVAANVTMFCPELRGEFDRDAEKIRARTLIGVADGARVRILDGIHRGAVLIRAGAETLRIWVAEP